MNITDSDWQGSSSSCNLRQGGRQDDMWLVSSLVVVLGRVELGLAGEAS